MQKVFNILSDLSYVKMQDNGSLEIEGMASTNDVDRIGDVISPDAWQGGLKDFLKNPIILFNHDYGRPIGKATKVEITENGLKIRANISKAAGDVYEYIKEGILKTFSVGFIIEDAKYMEETGGLKILKATLIENSVVTVPMNQDAVFSIAKSFDSEKEWKEYASKFKKAGLESGDGVNTPEPNNTPVPAASSATKEKIDMTKEEIQALAKAEADKVAAKLAMEKAEEKAKAEAAASKAEIEAKIANLEVGKSGAEKLAEDLRAELAKKDADWAETLKQMKDEIAEKAAELETIRKSRHVFTDRSEGNKIKTFGKDILTAHMLGVITGKGYNTEFARNLAEKAGIDYTTDAPDLDQEIQDNIQKEIEVFTRVAALFREIQVNGASTILPFQSDVGYAAWAADATAGNLANREDAPAANTYGAKQITLTAHRLVSSSFMNNDTDEQVLIALMPMLVEGVARAHARTVEGAILNGGGPITGLDGLAPATPGFSISLAGPGAGTLTAANLLAMRAQMGKFGLNPADVAFLVNQTEYYSLLQDGAFQNLNEVGDMATKIKGLVGAVYGSPVVVSDEFVETPANGVPGAFAVNVRNYLIPRLRGVTVEQDYEVMNQRRVIVASQALGFTEIQGGNGTTYEPVVKMDYVT